MYYDIIGPLLFVGLPMVMFFVIITALVYIDIL